MITLTDNAVAAVNIAIGRAADTAPSPISLQVDPPAWHQATHLQHDRGDS
ncbi:hypothetical protein MicloDRAFT_00069970 [Microvirga lotononidis]|uniref:Uncharacterized protein n=1 Tax=Microvirga lotononidis TaxID=864069 RepID=I4YK52_9HYPH|nr:hypothetical protein MicloDRAFT_00069970 [Microvirga lotononidis]